MPDDVWVTQSGFVRSELASTVYEATVARFRQIYTLADRVTISFSGGKDSTALLHMALLAAREYDRLPLEVWFFDDELLDPDTIEHVERLAQWEELDFKWYCLPVQHSLRSNFRTHWYTWDPDEKDVWPRSLPPGAITEMPGWTKENARGLPEISTHVSRLTNEQLGVRQHILCAGIRGPESFNRVRAIMQGGHFISKKYSAYWYARPIYDWRTRDVWKAIRENDWPYSAFYDRIRAYGITNIEEQRVAPWGNVAQSRSVHVYAALYPEFWEKAMRRMPELRAQNRYGNTKLYRVVQNKPPGLTWQEYTLRLIAVLPEEDRQYWVRQLKSILKRWERKTSMPFPEEALPGGGMNCWKILARSIAKNDRIGGSSRDLM